MSRLPGTQRTYGWVEEGPEWIDRCERCNRVLASGTVADMYAHDAKGEPLRCPTCYPKETPMSKQRVHASLEAVELQTRAVEETATRLATKVYDLRSMVYTAREEVAGTPSLSTPVAWTRDMALAALESLGSFSVRRAAIEAMDGWSAERHAAARLSAAGALHMIAFPQQVDGIDPRD